MMKYHSLLDPDKLYSFREAVELGIAPDGSLFVPASLPPPSFKESNDSASINLKENAFNILRPFVDEDLEEGQLQNIIDYVFQFEFPIQKLAGSDIYVEELFHGPTYAFKDVGARFLAGCLQQWNNGKNKRTVLVATSGDTGGAVAHAFREVIGVDVIILFPKGRISDFQLQQIAGQGKNIHAIAVVGSFDDCQSIVKACFHDQALSAQLNLTSANSINLARWIPQMIFHLLAWHYLNEKKHFLQVVVPSGNYGNISSGLLLSSLGYPFTRLVAAHNQNDTIPRYLKNHQYDPHKTISTFANAMDVSDPGNFGRFQYLINLLPAQLRPDFNAVSVSDLQILNAIRDCWERHGYLLDPHTATGYHILNDSGQGGLILATAHPFKFKDIIESALGYFPETWVLNQNLNKINVTEIPPDKDALTGWLTSRI